jgi:hypothetical protein
MRKMIIGLVAASFIFWSCGGKDPAQGDVIGRWRGPDTAILDFNQDGTFTARSFPAEYVLLPKNKFINVRFDGEGKWLLRKGNTNWEVYLDFTQVSDKNCSSSFPLLMEGENGALGNKPPWHLFVWKGEEGGERYKFLRK